MGLDISHDAWHGAYSAFMRWRQKLMEVAELPPLEFMEGFWEKDSYRDPLKEYAQRYPGLAETIYACLPISWEILKPDPLHELLRHSDCDGELSPKSAAAIADRLEQLLPLLKGEGGGHIGDYRDKTQAFIEGARKAAAAKKPLLFR